MARTKAAEKAPQRRKKAAKEPKPVRVGVSKAPIGPDGEYVIICEVWRRGEEYYTVYPVPDEVRLPYLNGLLQRAADGLSKL